MAVFRDNPYASNNFLVDLGTGDEGSVEAGLLEVVFPEARLSVQNYRAGNDKTTEPRKLLAQTEYGNLILRRAGIGSLSWYTWWNAARNGDVKNVVRNVAVRLLSEDRAGAVLTWKFIHARPVCHQFSSLHALGAGSQLETLELAFERLEME
jgi:phage tail-like protein